MGRGTDDDRTDDDLTDGESRENRERTSRRRDALCSSLAVAVVFVVGDVLVQGEVTLGTVLAGVLGPLPVLGIAFHPGPLPSRPAKIAAVLLSAAFVGLALGPRF